MKTVTLALALALVPLLVVAGTIFAAQAPTANHPDPGPKPFSGGDGAFTPRVGGEDIGSAVVIPALPFSDTGATCGYVNNYDEVCPYTGSTSADVVYSYTPASNGALSVDLCASQYDTKVYIYAGGVGNPIACNDDAGCGYSGYQSKITNAAVSAGVTYYIVVDGYGGSCGTYDMELGVCCGCQVMCPVGGIPEGEPPCGDNYLDSWNGGCNSSPHVFQPLEAVSQGCVDLCGKSGTYLYQGLSYRDTDWFDIIGTGETATAVCVAEFPLQLIFIWGPDCNNLQYDITTSGYCENSTLSHFVEAGAHAWIWVGAQVFTGIPCDADYVLRMCGIAGGGVPVEAASWGGIKSLYRSATR